MGHDNDKPDLAADGAAERSPRTKTLLVAECRREDGSVHKIRVRDLSATGLKGDCSEVIDFEVGEPVKVRFTNLAPIAASVARYDFGELGITFKHPVKPEHIAMARSRTILPGQSPRSEVVSDWIERAERERRMFKAQHGIKGPRPL